jgi:hypothetical protein
VVQETAPGAESDRGRVWGRKRTLWTGSSPLCRGRGLGDVGAGEYPGDESENGAEESVNKMKWAGERTLRRTGSATLLPLAHYKKSFFSRP